MSEPYLRDPDFVLYNGDALDVLRDLPGESVHCCVTSPPYLDIRPEYDCPTELGFGAIFGELRRVVAGPMLWNVGRLWRGGIEQLWWTGLIRQAAIAGWQHWDTEVWIKPNANPIHGRVLANSHEYTLIFGRDGVVLNEDAVRTPYAQSSLDRHSRPWRNHGGTKSTSAGQLHQRRTPVNTAGARPRSYFEACVGVQKGNEHPAPMAEEFAAHLVMLASWPEQTVLDPFMGSGTTALVARKLGRKSIGIELNVQYAELAARRLQQQSLFADVEGMS